MTQLPDVFIQQTRQLMGTERFERYLQSFEEEPPVSIRLNPRKTADGQWTVEDAEPVAWCRHAYYLKRRPNFTMDPLLHAGCYYVQEAASMFLDEVLRQLSTLNSQLSTVNCLDLCAAPGGKSTLLRAALPESCVLYSNEPVGNRASILLENVTKWGYPNHRVTNLYPKAYRQAKASFDLILCDVPCSGEGMFRKDPATIHEWSPQQVAKCSQLQRTIVADAWACLKDGGLLIYSTCTFNTLENEENIRWMLSAYDDAEVVAIDTRPEWHITGSLLQGFDEPVYRFIPGITRGEGLFMCVLRKRAAGEEPGENSQTGNKRFPNWEHRIPLLGIKDEATTDVSVELTYQQAIAYLRREALVLPPETPRGLVSVTFQGFPLGMVKNIGSRANNLYPKEWKIKTTHISTEYEAILRHT